MMKQASIRVEVVDGGEAGEVAVLTSNNPEYEKALAAALVSTNGGNWWEEGPDSYGHSITYYYNRACGGEYAADLYRDLVNQIRGQ